MKFSTRSDLHEEILNKYPRALKLVDCAIETGEVKEGTLVVNHPNIPPTEITNEMLKRGFPSLQESFYFYVIEPNI